MASISRTAQSRLKSRKVLGVGECADGNIPRSKISQLLGQNELQPWTLPEDNYPVGLRVFQWITCIYFGLIGLVTVWNPQYVFLHSSYIGVHRDFGAKSLAHQIVSRSYVEQAITSQDATSQSPQDMRDLLALMDFPVRLYGVAMLSLAVFFLLCTLANRSNRRCIRLSLLVVGFYLLAEMLVSISSCFSPHNLSTWSSIGAVLILNVTIRSLVIAMSFFYYSRTNVPRENGQKRQD